MDSLLPRRATFDNKMHFLNILVAAVAAGSAVAAPAESGSKQKRKSKFMWTGVNQSGGEFGQTTIPGTLGKQYTWPVTSSIDVCHGQAHPKQEQL